MILFSLLIVVLAVAVILLLAYFAVVLFVRTVALAVTLFKLLTGRMTREQLAEIAAVENERRARRAERRRQRFERLFGLGCSNIEDVAQGKC